MLMMRSAPPWLLRIIYWPTVLTVRRDPQRLRAQITTLGKAMSEPDQAVYNMPEYQDALCEAFCAAFRRGSRGPVLDLKLCSQAWGQWLQDIPSQVYLWHGEADRNTPIAMARYLERMIPNCRTTFYADEGHISVMHHHGQEILRELISGGNIDLKQ